MAVIVAATQNKYKIAEIRKITGDFGFQIVSMKDAGLPPIDVVEDGETFEENSYKKASEIMKLCSEITIADDSGLEVDFLDGAPGVYSARFAGENCNDGENNIKLLKLMKDVPAPQRGAQFVCVISLLYPDGRKITARGECRGHIAFEEKGENGFGYDSLFIPEGYKNTFGELSAEIKNRISHRGKALVRLREILEEENRCNE